MFTGLVEEVGSVRSVLARGEYRRVSVTASMVLDGLRLGDSIAIEGACQTVVELGRDWFAVDTLAETLRKTTFAVLARGARVNLERAVRVGDRLGGHMVQGHVDGVGTITRIDTKGVNVWLEVGLPAALHRYCIDEGSIAISGISLTIAKLTDAGVRLNIIPETWRRTTLADLSVGDSVNIEADVIARYVERLLAPSQASDAPRATATPSPESRLNARALTAWGYGGEQ